MTINEYRKALGWTVKELLKAMEISLSTYKRISNGTQQLTKFHIFWLDAKLRNVDRRKKKVRK